MIAQAIGPADTIEQERLKLAAGDVVVRVTRIRSIGDQPASHELAVLALARLPGLIPDADMQDDIVALARTHGVDFGRATTEVFDTIHAATDVAELLGIDPNDAVLKLDRVVRCARGLPIEWRVTYAVP